MIVNQKLKIYLSFSTSQLIFSYILWPLAAVMGVNIEDCRKVAKLIGIKTFVNEFVAYLELKVIFF